MTLAMQLMAHGDAIDDSPSYFGGHCPWPVRHAEQESTSVAVAVADSSLVEAQSNMNIAERYMISQLSGADDTSNADDDGHEDEAASSWCMFMSCLDRRVRYIINYY